MQIHITRQVFIICCFIICCFTLSPLKKKTKTKKKHNLPPSLQETHFITVDDLEEAVKELIDAWMNAIFFNSLFAKSTRKTVKSF